MSTWDRPTIDQQQLADVFGVDIEEIHDLLGSAPIEHHDEDGSSSAESEDTSEDSGPEDAEEWSDQNTFRDIPFISRPVINAGPAESPIDFFNLLFNKTRIIDVGRKASKTRIMDVGRKAAGLKWSWAGHVARMHPDRWARLVTEWLPKGRRNRGRPKKKWRDELDAVDKEWPNTAKDRDVWKERGEAFAQQWDTNG